MTLEAPEGFHSTEEPEIKTAVTGRRPRKRPLPRLRQALRDEDTVDKSTAVADLGEHEVRTLQDGIEALDKEVKEAGRKKREKCSKGDSSNFAHGDGEPGELIPAPATSSREDPPGSETKVKLLLPTVRTVKGSAGPPGKSPGNGGRLGLMREIRPADRLVRDTGKGLDNGVHLVPLKEWSRENHPVVV